MNFKRRGNDRTRHSLWYFMIKEIEVFWLISSTNNLLRHMILKQTIPKKNMTTQFRSKVSWLVEIQLKDKLDKRNIEERENDKVRWIVPKPKTKDVEPSTNVTYGKGAGDIDLENMWELPVRWVMVPESRTHLVDEKIYYHSCFFFFKWKIGSILLLFKLI